MKIYSLKSLKFFLLLIAAQLIVTICFVSPFISDAFAMHIFEPWEDHVFVAMGEQHGTAAAERLRKVHDLIVEHQDKPVAEKLALVNDYMNSLPWIADSVLWNREDYWAAPFETIATYGGDCEDIVILKYEVLRLLGIPDKKLGFAYVQNSNKEPHMVLIYTESSDTDPLILDNQHPNVMPSNKRRDIKWIYVFQNDGTLYLIDDDGRNDRRLMARLEDIKLAKWDSSKERARKYSDYYKKYNGGRPLISE
jgi:predicted transglutaminase-like cysteine proteinase